MPVRATITAILCVLLSITAAAQHAALAGGSTRCAARPFPGAVPGALAATSGLVIVGTENGAIHAFTSPELEVKWRAELGGEFVSDLFAVGDGVLAVMNATGESQTGDTRSRLLFVSSQSGVTVWAVRLPRSERYYLGLVNGSVAAISQEGAIVLVNPADGQIVRLFDSKGRVTTRPAFGPAGTLFGTADGKIYLISAKGAEFAFDHDSEHKPTSVGFLKDEGFAVGDDRGYLAKYGPQDGKPIWKFKGGAAISSVVETKEGLLITSLDNFVYMLSDYNGDVVWKRRLTGRVLDGALLLDSFLVSLVYGENTAFVLDTEKGRVLDMVNYTDSDLVSRVAVRTGANSFVIASTEGLRTYSIGPCAGK